MLPERFRHLLSLVEPRMYKQSTVFRRVIPAVECPALIVRFLATADTQQSLSFSFRIGKSTMRKIIKETCDAIFDHDNKRGTMAKNFQSV